MNDSPGWASPGSSPSDRSDGDEERTTSEDAPPQAGPQGPPADQQPPNWAAQQPPSAPGTGWGAPPQSAGGRGGPGRTGGGKWNNGWNGWAPPQPTAAKPGVIPLRPLSVFEILDGAVTTMRAHWRTVLGISLAVAVVIQVVATAATRKWMPDADQLDALSNGTAPTPDELTEQLGATLGATSVSVFVQQLGVVVITAMLTFVVSRAVLGRSVSLGEAWRDSRPRLLRLLGLLFLITLLVAAVVAAGFVPGAVVIAAGATAPGTALFLLGGVAGTVAAVWLWVRFSLAAPSLMLEKQGVVTAMRRSAKLVRGNGWRIFGILLLTQLLVLTLTTIFQLPASLLATSISGSSDGSMSGALEATNSWTFLITSGIGEVLAYTIALPISAGVTALLYLDQRIRREALDLELARSAGITGYGDAGSPASGG